MPISRPPSQAIFQPFDDISPDILPQTRRWAFWAVLMRYTLLCHYIRHIAIHDCHFHMTCVHISPPAHEAPLRVIFSADVTPRFSRQAFNAVRACRCHFCLDDAARARRPMLSLLHKMLYGLFMTYSHAFYEVFAMYLLISSILFLPSPNATYATRATAREAPSPLDALLTSRYICRFL